MQSYDRVGCAGEEAELVFRYFHWFQADVDDVVWPGLPRGNVDKIMICC